MKYIGEIIKIGETLMASVGIITAYNTIPTNIFKIDGSVHHENFKIEWRELAIRFNNVRGAIIKSNNAVKVISDLVNDLAELIHFNSSLLTVRTSTFGTNTDIHEHFKIHVSKEIFTKKGVSFFGNLDNALKYAELIYVDDSIIRFLPELLVKPKDIHEKEICMTGSPKEILDWISDFENLHYLFSFKGEKANELLEKISREKNDIIKTAIKMNMYLPISPKKIISEDKEFLLDMIKKSWIRNKTVNPNIVLNYLYLNEIENLKSIGFND